jgi:S-adenosylmethionine-diacylglycerol 3-amino-3-carboxypropyl transferase
VTAVDLNPYQLALCELKRAAIKELDFETFFAIFAEQNIERLRQNYGRLRPQLSTHASIFWDSKLPKMTTIMYSGSSGWLAYLLFRVILPICGFGWIRQALLEGVSKEEFRRRVREHEGRLQFLAWVSDSILMPLMAPLAGVPEAQLNLGDERDGNVHTIIERVFLNSDLVNDNYFFLGYILGFYTRDCCPRYLRAEHYDTLKAAMHAGKFELFHGTLADRLRLDADQATPPTYTAAILLDHLDWMDDGRAGRKLGERELNFPRRGPRFACLHTLLILSVPFYSWR